MMRTTYGAIQELLVHLEGSNPPVRARLIAEARRGVEQKPDCEVACVQKPSLEAGETR